jgi:hypothetical protein
LDVPRGLGVWISLAGSSVSFAALDSGFSVFQSVLHWRQTEDVSDTSCAVRPLTPRLNPLHPRQRVAEARQVVQHPPRPQPRPSRDRLGAPSWLREPARLRRGASTVFVEVGAVAVSEPADTRLSDLPRTRLPDHA